MSAKVQFFKDRFPDNSGKTTAPLLAMDANKNLFLGKQIVYFALIGILKKRKAQTRDKKRSNDVGISK